MDGLLFIGMHAALRGGLILRTSEWAHAPAHTVRTKLNILSDVWIATFFYVQVHVEGLGMRLGHNWKGETKSLAQSLLGMSEWRWNETKPKLCWESGCPGNEARPKLCWEYQSGLGMRLGPSCVGVSWE